LIISPSLSAHGISTSAEEPYPLNSAAPLATILDDVAAFGVGGAFLNLHRLFANETAQELYQRAFIVVQMISPRHFVQASFPLRLQPEPDRAAECFAGYMVGRKGERAKTAREGLAQNACASPKESAPARGAS
jgi:hypothetical protein